MWTYEQATGKLTRDGQLVAEGYSGYGEGKNNPACEQTPNIGPIPRGRWRFGIPRNTDTHGPYVMTLAPMEAETFGRSGFLVHGDSRTAPGTASHGCIILSRSVREKMHASGDRELEVI